jgi:murein DD-endopeptidase MepM/ murein hydrolase activator NlpD
MSVRSLILVLVMVSGVTVALYAYLAPSFAAHFPFACNIPSPPSTHPEPVACPPGEQPLACREVQSNGCQEISELTGEGETLLSLLKDNLEDETWARRVAANLASLIQTSLGRPFAADTVLDQGKSYSVAVDAGGNFLKATIELKPADVFHAVRQGDAVKSWKEDVVLGYKREAVSFPMRGDLFESVRCAGEGKDLAAKLRDVFKYDIDFQSDSVRGDVCKVFFERRYADDRPSGYGDILCAVYEGKKKSKVAIRFDHQSGAKYYDAKGVELYKTFLVSPLGVKRLMRTSGFGPRIHPVTRCRKDHKGVDYGAPQGTHVLAVAAGEVVFSGWNGGYGNHVWIKHKNGHVTRYGHLKKIDVKNGQYVAQGKRIGLVGMTGMATGPHLDFEFLENGKHVNPERKLNKALAMNPQVVPQELKSRFNEVKEERLGSLNGTVPGRRSASSASAAVKTVALP